MGLAQRKQGGEQVSDPVVLEDQHWAGARQLKAGRDRDAFFLARHSEHAAARPRAGTVDEVDRMIFSVLLARCRT